MDRTRKELRLAALELFASEGFDRVKAEDIAERAGVSRRTFFRYFETKEDVLYIGEHRFFDVFATTFLAFPASVSDVAAVCASFAALASRTERGRDALLLYRKAISSSAVLRGREQDHVRVDMDLVGRAIADRHHLAEPDDRCRLLAATALTTYRIAFDKWLDGPAHGDLAKVVVNEFALLAEVVQQGPSAGAPFSSD